MTKYWVGIDPGLQGAVAILAADGTMVAVHDTPVLALRTSRGSRHEYDLPGMAALLKPYGPHGHVVIEEAQAMPGQGVRSMFTIGLGFGAWLGVIGALGLAHTPPLRPATWKHRLGLPGAKEAARLRAIQLFPAADLRRKKDHGRAEALLLAYWGWRLAMSGGTSR